MARRRDELVFSHLTHDEMTRMKRLRSSLSKTPLLRGKTDPKWQTMTLHPTADEVAELADLLCLAPRCAEDVTDYGVAMLAQQAAAMRAAAYQLLADLKAEKRERA